MSAGKDRIYAYFLLNCLMDVKEGVDISGYTPENPPSDGDVVLRWDNPGTNTHPLRFEDGPITWFADGVFLGSGEMIDGVAHFDTGVKRVLNLLAIGQHSEAVLRSQIHEFADACKERIDANPMGEDAIRAIDQLERNWFKIK